MLRYCSNSNSTIVVHIISKWLYLYWRKTSSCSPINYWFKDTTYNNQRRTVNLRNTDYQPNTVRQNLLFTGIFKKSFISRNSVWIIGYLSESQSRYLRRIVIKFTKFLYEYYFLQWKVSLFLKFKLSKLVAWSKSTCSWDNYKK